jgi:hypothetical protein
VTLSDEAKRETPGSDGASPYPELLSQMCLTSCHSDLSPRSKTSPLENSRPTLQETFTGSLLFQRLNEGKTKMEILVFAMVVGFKESFERIADFSHLTRRCTLLSESVLGRYVGSKENFV